MWAVDGLTALAGFQLSFEILGLDGSIQWRTLHHCVSLSSSLADQLCRLWLYFVSFFSALCSFLVTLTESIFSVYKLSFKGKGRVLRSCLL